MMRFPRYAKTLADIAIILLLAFHAATLVRLPFVETLERIASDIRLRATLPGGIDDRIVIADIDEKSISNIGHWPWNRDKLAELVDTLFDHYQVNVVGFDMVFPEVDDSAGLRVLQALDDSAVGQIDTYRETAAALKPQFEFDARFGDAIMGRNVVLGYVFDQDDAQTINRLPTAWKTIESDMAESLMLYRPRGYTANLPVLQAGQRGAGFFDNPNLDIDGQFRRAPVLQVFDNGLYPSLALAVTRAALDNAQFDIPLMDNKKGYASIERMQVGSLLIPLDKTGSAPVPYRGPQGSYPYISISDILDRSAPTESLADRIVLVGTTAPGMLDLRATPVGSTYPGVEVHANIIGGMLDGRIPRQPTWVMALEIFVLVLLGLLVMIVPRWLRPLWIIAFLVSLAGLVIAANFWSWNQGLILPLASPLLLIIGIFSVHMSWGFLVESRGKRLITKLFGNYVPKELVDEMALNPENVTLEGQARDMTVLFTDVRGFTTISEGLSPKELSTLMNEFLTPMTRVIHEHRGTIDKYMGDAIMAFWGAPLDHNDHAHAGVKTAHKMIDGLIEINQEFARRGWPEIKLGVGLNTGTMNVGNMGSEFRMAYTVLGDAVNLGARLESLTKQYGVPIIVSESTRDAASDYAFLHLDKVRVKGKTKPVAIFEPMGLKEDVSPAQRDYMSRFHKALKFFWAQDWDNASRLLSELIESASKPDSEDWHRPLYEIYVDRIAAYRQHPPGPDWDGVFIHESK